MQNFKYCCNIKCIYIYWYKLIQVKIEDEIKQPKFKTDYQKMIINIIFTAGWISVRNSEMLKAYKVTTQQYNILRILKGQYPKPATVNLLIDRMLDKMSNASRIVDRLHAKKLVTRTACPEDRRRVDVVITDKGLKLLDKVDDMEAHWEKYFKNLTKKEVRQINELLDKFRN